ncbi:hypothetical protein V8F33_008791 [Rhypophila sp. PSN 637]
MGRDGTKPSTPSHLSKLFFTCRFPNCFPCKRHWAAGGCGLRPAVRGKPRTSGTWHLADADVAPAQANPRKERSQASPCQNAEKDPNVIRALVTHPPSPTHTSSFSYTFSSLRFCFCRPSGPKNAQSKHKSPPVRSFSGFPTVTLPRRKSGQKLAATSRCLGTHPSTDTNLGLDCTNFIRPNEPTIDSGEPSTLKPGAKPQKNKGASFLFRRFLQIALVRTETRRLPTTSPLPERPVGSFI